MSSNVSLHSDLASHRGLRTHARSMDLGWGWDSCLRTYGCPWKSPTTQRHSSLTQHSKPWVLVGARQEWVTVPASSFWACQQLWNHTNNTSLAAHMRRGASFPLHAPTLQTLRIHCHSCQCSGRWGLSGQKRAPRLSSPTSHHVRAYTEVPPEGREEDNAGKQDKRGPGQDLRLGTQRVLSMSTPPLSIQADWERTHWEGGQATRSKRHFLWQL